MTVRLRQGTGGVVILRLLLFLILFVFCATQGDAASGERILNFDSYVTVMPDSSLVVTEKIQVYAAQVDIRRGIIREFPVIYNVNGRTRRVGFELINSILDGRSVPADTKQVGSMLEIRLGDPNVFLPVGVHIFELTYKTTGQLGFFDSWDELYWNVTGNGWVFPIDSVRFTVQLPTGAKMTKYDAFTGVYGGRGRFFTQEGMVFKTTQPLAPGEGFTVAVGWPKGFVTPPIKTFGEKLVDLHVQYPLLAMLFYLLIFIAVRIMLEKRYGKNGSLCNRGTVIPLFYPPDGMEPAQLRYAKKFKYDDVSNSSNIIYLAVNGFLRIKDENENLYLYKAYEGDIFEDKKAMELNLSLANKAFLGHIFQDREEIMVGKGPSELLYTAFLRMRDAYDRPRYRRQNLLAHLSFLILFVPLHLIMLNSAEGNFLLLSVAGQILVVLSAIVSAPFFSWKYSSKWGAVYDKVEGFLLYLKVAEKNRLEILYPYAKGRVPEQTPELFERYLPYALSLDVAKTWASSFSSVLEQSQYIPTWYESSDINRGFTLMRLGRLQRNVGMVSAAAKAYSPPAPVTRSGNSSGGGWGSGLGGGGFSGGGGGGGGGRGW